MKFKKTMFLLLLISSLFQTGCGQTPNQNQEAMQTTKYLYDWELPKEARAAWDTLFKDFFETTFAPELAKRKLRQDCKTCGDIFYEYQFSISAEGRMIGESKIREEIDCPNVPSGRISDLENSLLEYFRKVKFPEALLGFHIKAKIGKVTRC